jgi:predicted RecB family endonuclease
MSGACVTVTVFGLPVAPFAVIVMEAVRDDEDVLAEKLQVMGPELIPLLPDVIVSQLPDVTSAVQDIVPVPVLDTLKPVEPASLDTF